MSRVSVIAAVESLRKKIGSYLSPSGRLLYYSSRIAAYAHRDWVTWFFFLVYFLDSFLIFLPAESLLALTLLLARDRMRMWVLAAVAGALSGFIIFYLLSLSSFQPMLLDFIEGGKGAEQFLLVTTYARQYGYAALIGLVFLFVPQVVGLVAGILVGLNPLIVFFIILGAKIFRIFAMIYAMRFAQKYILRIRLSLIKRRELKRDEKESL